MLPAMLEDLSKISPIFLITCISQQWEHLRQLEQPINEAIHQIEMPARQHGMTTLVMSLSSERQLAAWLGLVPRQHSREENLCCWGPVSAETAIFVNCLFMEAGQLYL